MVKCADCGFLAYWLGDSEYPEVEGPSRKYFQGHRDLVCFVDKADFKDEWNKASLIQTDEHTLFAVPAHLAWQHVIDAERDCVDGFIQWRKGYSPKEHGAMFDRQWMIDREDRRDNEMRDREDKRDREARWRHRWELLVFGGLIAIATLAAAVLSPVVTDRLEDAPLTPTQVPSTATSQPTPTG